MSRDWRSYLGDMLVACERVSRYVGGRSREAFLADELVYDAVVRNLEILGEAAKHIPDDVKVRMPDVAWREISGMRDWLAHAYFKINSDVLWNAVDREVPLLLGSLQAFKDEDQP
jgi:uncharacterized protein with HEPN domain